MGGVLGELSSLDRKLLSTPIGSVPYVILDMEMTGGNPEKNTIIEIYGIRYQDGVLGDDFHQLINPCMPIPPMLRRITGISHKMVAHCPVLSEVMGGFLEFIGDAVLVAHNVHSDLSFLRYYAKKLECHTLTNFFLCTHLLATKLIPEACKKDLKGLSLFLGTEKMTSHRAQGDAMMTYHLFEELQKRLLKKSFITLSEVMRFQGDFHSLSRLGWQIPQHVLDRVPSQSAFFSLYDPQKRLLMRGCSLDLQKDMQHFSCGDVLSKSAQKRVHQASDITFQPTEHILEGLFLHLSCKDYQKYKKLYFYFCDVYVLKCVPTSTHNDHKVSVGKPVREAAWMLATRRSVRILKTYMMEMSQALDHVPVERGTKREQNKDKNITKQQVFFDYNRAYITSMIQRLFFHYSKSSHIKSYAYYYAYMQCWLQCRVSYAVWKQCCRVVKKYVSQFYDVSSIYAVVAVSRAQPSRFLIYAHKKDYGIDMHSSSMIESHRVSSEKAGKIGKEDKSHNGYDVFPLLAGQIYKPFYIVEDIAQWLAGKEARQLKIFMRKQRAESKEQATHHHSNYRLSVGLWLVSLKKSELAKIHAQVHLLSP